VKSDIEVPQGWQVVKISDVSKTYAGGTPSRYNKSFFNGDILWVKSGEVDGQFIEGTSERITEEALQKSSAKIIPENTVLIAMYGATAGKVGFLKREGASNQAVLAIPNNKVNFNSLFMYYLLSSKTEKIMKTTQGTGQPNLSKTLVERTKILLPTLKEQQKIADILSKVDEQIDLTEKIIDKTEEMKKGLMQKLLTKGIGHTKFKKTELGEIPMEWEIRQLKQIAKNIQYGYTTSSKQDKVGPKFLRITDIQNGNVDWNSVPYCECNDGEFKKYQLKTGDIVFARTGATTGKSYIIKSPPDSIFASYLIKVRINDDYSKEFIHFFFQTNDYWKQIKSNVAGSSQGGVNATKLSNLKISIPNTYDEQKQIASILSKVDEHIQDNKKELKHLKELKKGLMQDLLTGKVRVSV
jgi:type I restriction enzyme S subunit